MSKIQERLIDIRIVTFGSEMEDLIADIPDLID